MIKQSSMLFAAALFSYGVPHVYAETLITPKMSKADIIKALEEHGVLIDRDSPQSGGIETDYSTLHPVQPYVSFDNSKKETYIPNLTCSSNPPFLPPDPTIPNYGVTGADMANVMGTFYITANTNKNSDDKVAWVALPADDTPLTQAGVAVGNGWMLLENGDTYRNDWWLITQAGVTVKSIKIDLWHNDALKFNPKSGVFDVGGNGSEVTAGSKHGYPFTKDSSGWPSDTAVVYSVPIVKQLSDPAADLYGVMTINFPSGFSGNLSLNMGGFLMFIADTDCLAVTEAKATSNGDGFDITLTGIGGGMAYAQRTCGEVSHIISTYDVPPDGLTFSVAKSDLLTGCDYSFTDEAGNAITLLVDGQEMPDNEYRP